MHIRPKYLERDRTERSLPERRIEGKIPKEELYIGPNQAKNRTDYQF